MNSELAVAVRRIVAYFAVPSVTDSTAGRIPDILLTVDQVLATLAVLLVGCVGVWCVARPAGDPLANAPERRNRIREDSVALAVLVWLTAAALASGLVRMLSVDTQGPMSALIIGNTAHLAGIAVCLGIAATRFDGGIRRYCLGQRGAGSSFWVVGTVVFTVLAIGICPMVRDATISAILYLAPEFEFSPHPTITALKDAQPIAMTVALWAGAAIVAPVAEELFFRGIVQTFLVRVLPSRWLAIVAASVVFGAIHYGQPHAVAALVVLAVLIGYVYERTGSLLPPILIHAAFNLKTLLWEALGALPA